MNTISILARLPLYNISRKTGLHLAMPANYTYALTYRCTSRCKTCGIWKQNRREITAQQWKKIIDKTGKLPFWTTITGGNIFLRQDLNKILSMIVRTNKPRILNIPICGTHPKETLDKMRQFMQETGNTQVITNISIDGTIKTHDKIRGSKGDFSNTMQIFKELKKLQGKHKNLHVCTCTVISKYNMNETDKIFSFLSDLKPDHAGFELAEHRKELSNPGDYVPGAKEQHDIYTKILQFQKKNKKNDLIGKNLLRQSYYRHMQDLLLGKNTVPCFAGIASIHVASDGTVWECSNKASPIGNLLKDDLKTILKGETAAKARAKTKGCSCGLTSAYYTSRLCTI
ncbi:MAG: radical SAM protein [Candidatus Woesearchaeota archaeon]